MYVVTIWVLNFVCMWMFKWLKIKPNFPMNATVWRIFRILFVIAVFCDLLKYTNNDTNYIWSKITQDEKQKHAKSATNDIKFDLFINYSTLVDETVFDLKISTFGFNFKFNLYSFFLFLCVHIIRVDRYMQLLYYYC